MIQRIFFLFLSLFAASNITHAQDTVRVMHYNLLMYGSCDGVTLDQKDGWLQSIVSHYRPDILTVNEMGDRILYANRIKQKALTYGNMEYTDFTNTTGSDLVNMLFYNKDKFGYKGIRKIGNSIRDINVYTLYHKGSIAGGDTLFLDCIVAHFKAGNTASDANQRKVAAQSVMNWIAAQGPDYRNYLFMGDFNLYSANDSAWQYLAFHPNQSIRFPDPAGKANGWGSGTREILTQSPANNRSDCGTGGGLDDRFDFILPSPAVMNGTHEVQYLPNTYFSYGNDGNTGFNQDLRCTGNTMVPLSVCASLIQMSDHLPVVMQMAINRSSTAITPDRFALPGLELKVVSPFQEALELSLQPLQPQQELKLDLLGMDGRTLYSRLLPPLSQPLDLSLPATAFSPGLYLLRISDAQGRQLTRKVLKQ